MRHLELRWFVFAEENAKQLATHAAEQQIAGLCQKPQSRNPVLVHYGHNQLLINH